MAQHDLVLSLHAQGKSATKICQHFVQVFVELAIAYRQSQELSDDRVGRSPMKMRAISLGGLPTRQSITSEAEIPASTVWYVLTRRAQFWILIGECSSAH
jgi:hypothetical protein